MSLSLSLMTALSGLQANQSALRVTSNNVANVNTEGYSRKSVELASRVLAGIGTGVDVGAITRSVDARLQLQVRDGLSATAALETAQTYMQRVQELFGAPGNDSSIANRLSGLAQSLTELSAAPESPTVRTSVVDAATKVTRLLNTLSDSIQDLRRDADQELAQAVKVVNSQLQTVVSLNEQIAFHQATGLPTADLEDTRDGAVSVIAEYMDIGTYVRDTGEMVIHTAGGRILADRQANTLAHDAASAIGPSMSYAGGSIQPLTLNGTDITGEIRGGKMAALIEARDTRLPNLQAELDRLTEQLRDRINEIHNQGTAFPAPASLTGSRSFTDPTTDSLTISSDVRIAVTDASGAFVNDFVLAAGTYTVDQVRDAINANLGPDAVATTSAGGPLAIAASATGNGIAIADLGAQTVNFGADSFNGFSNFFGLNDLFVTNGVVNGDSPTGISGLVQVRADIVANPALIARGSLQDPATATQALLAGDNGIATALAAKFDETLSFNAAGDLALTRTTLAGYGAEIIADASLRTDTLRSDAEFQRSLQEELTFQHRSLTGVNLDEELSKLIVYQNAYQASARVIGVTQEMFDVLDQIVR